MAVEFPVLITESLEECERIVASVRDLGEDVLDFELVQMSRECAVQVCCEITTADGLAHV